MVSLIIIASIVLTISSSSAEKINKYQLHIKRPLKQTAAVRKSNAGHGLDVLSKDPYSGAIVIDAADGRVLFEENADSRGYPASMVKLMGLLIILEAVQAEHLTLQDEIIIPAEAARMGGSQVYLEEKEVYTVDDLLYALMVQSANDAAVALALSYAGSKDAFVDLMNNRAQELGMDNTVFHSVHGLPPGKGQLPDVSTPRDMTKLCMELLKHPGALRYTSTRVRAFRTSAPEPFIMRNHNHLVRDFEGCDGLKTGYFRAAGFSIAATAARNGERAIAVIFGSADSKVRDTEARKLLSISLTGLAGAPASYIQGVTASVNESEKRIE